MRQRRRADIYALGAFIMLLGAVLSYWFINDDWLAEYDIMSFFLPWYGHLGDRLREFDIPGWMPWLSSGSPVAGDPSGGWWYFPVMLTFSLFGVTTAFKAMILIQTLIGGTAIYAFSRSIGLRPVAALMSTVTFVFGQFLAGQVGYGTVAGQASAWLPVALLGVECSLRSVRTLARVAWWSLTGLAIGQIAVSWPGQGLYNGLLIIALWVAYRSLIWPVDRERTLRGRCVDALTTGPAVLTFGLLLGAAGLLPRLHISGVSNIPNGDYAGVVGGNYLVTPHSFVTLLRDTLVDDTHFRPVALGAPLVILAMFALLVGRRRLGIPFFATIVVLAGILSMGETPLHSTLYLLPGFESIHTHSPRRLIWVCFIAPAMLAGAGLEALLSWRPRHRALPLLGIPLLAMIGAAVVLDRADFWIGWWPLILAGGATALAVVLVMVQRKGSHEHPHALARVAAVAMIVLVLVHPTARDIVARGWSASDSPTTNETCLDTYLSRTDPGGAGEFLQRQQEGVPPFRYVGYAGRDPSTNDSSYSARRCDPSVLAAVLGGRAVALELESVQGYNPVHLGVYAEYSDVMNGGRQDYHWVDPYPAELVSSPLLDMLNVRYIVVSLLAPHGQDDAQAIGAGKTEVFRNGEVVMFENPRAYARAWIVHEVRPNNDGEGLRLFANGTADGGEVAFIDGPLPGLQPVAASAAGAEHVVITGRDEDTLTAEVRANSAGLVVFSEIDEHGWNAYVDGEPAEILRTNHALRGVPIPAGDHTIELRYEPESLRLGLWISMLTAIAVVAVWAAAIRQWLIRARKSAPAGDHPDAG
ncbi:MAG: YfhO family protein [Chloroflexia bacterium]|nr:YfhO family protein [Chloroflexia bacterium]